MLFNDEQTETAIDIIHMVETAAKDRAPLPDPADVAGWETGAEAGNKEAYKQLMCARLQMIYPVIPEAPYRSDQGRLWQSIIDGRLEGILVVNSLDYKKAYEGYAVPPKPGSYLERWMNTAVRNEIVRAIADGWKPAAQ